MNIPIKQIHPSIDFPRPIPVEPASTRPKEIVRAGPSVTLIRRYVKRVEETEVVEGEVRLLLRSWEGIGERLGVRLLMGMDLVAQSSRAVLLEVMRGIASGTLRA